MEAQRASPFLRKLPFRTNHGRGRVAGELENRPLKLQALSGISQTS